MFRQNGDAEFVTAVPQDVGDSGITFEQCIDQIVLPYGRGGLAWLTEDSLLSGVSASASSISTDKAPRASSASLNASA